METIGFGESHSLSWKPFLLVLLVLFSGSDSFEWKSLLSLEASSFGGLVETVPFSGSHFFYWKQFLLVILLMEEFCFLRSLIFLWMLFLEWTSLFKEFCISHSKWWWNIFLLDALGSINKKVSSWLADSGRYGGFVGGEEGWVNPVRKKNSWQFFFWVMLSEVLKICEKWYLLM